MKYFLALAALTAGIFLCGTEAQAQQGYGNAYRGGIGFGNGLNSARCDYGQYGLYNHRVEQPPYFALYPPVYYNSNIVRRTMGISPFAAPAGVMPAEMIAPQPKTVVNPFFRSSPEKAPSVTASSKADSKT